MDRSIKEREVVKRIFITRECTWFVQAVLEETGLIAVSLGGKDYLTVFYDKKLETFVENILLDLENFCGLSFLCKKSIINEKGDERI